MEEGDEEKGVNVFVVNGGVDVMVNWSNLVTHDYSSLIESIPAKAFL